MNKETKDTLKYFLLSLAIICVIILGPYIFGAIIFIIDLFREVQ
jgi:hypothetical protein